MSFSKTLLRSHNQPEAFSFLELESHSANEKAIDRVTIWIHEDGGLLRLMRPTMVTSLSIGAMNIDGEDGSPSYKVSGAITIHLQLGERKTVRLPFTKSL